MKRKKSTIELECTQGLTKLSEARPRIKRFIDDENDNIFSLLFDLRNLNVYIPISDELALKLNSNRHIDKDTLKEMINNKKLIIVDFGEGPVLPIYFEEGKVEKAFDENVPLVGATVNFMDLMREISGGCENLFTLLLDPVEIKLNLYLNLIKDIINIFEQLEMFE